MLNVLPKYVSERATNLAISIISIYLLCSFTFYNYFLFVKMNQPYYHSLVKQFYRRYCRLKRDSNWDRQIEC